MTNAEAVGIFKDVKSLQVPWRVPATYLSQCFGTTVDPLNLRNACKGIFKHWYTPVM